MANSKLNKNWEATIESFANIINNDFLIKDILSSTKVLNSINEKLYKKPLMLAVIGLAMIVMLIIGIIILWNSYA